MSSRSPRSATACKVGSSRMESLRFAPSMTQPMGIGEQVGRDRPFPPDLGSVRGVGAGPFTTARGFVQAAVDGVFDELVEDPGGQPFGAPAAQGGLTGLTEPGCDVP